MDAILPEAAGSCQFMYRIFNELLKEQRSITPLMALRLSRLFGNSPAFGLNAQQARDLWAAAVSHQEGLVRIKPLHASA